MAKQNSIHNSGIELGQSKQPVIGIRRGAQLRGRISHLGFASGID